MILGEPQLHVSLVRQSSWTCLLIAVQLIPVQHACDLSLRAGQGSYGTVYKACVRDSDELVAIKIIPLGQQNEQAAIQKEIDMLKECEHPNIVRYMVRPEGRLRLQSSSAQMHLQIA